MPQLNRVIPRDDPDAPTTAALRRRLQIAGQLPSTVQTASAAIRHDRCLLCGCNIRNDRVADREIGACGSCKSRPEARRLQAASGTGASRAFTEAEKSLIRKTHGYIPIQQLLGILNERLKNDLGPNALPHTAEQLHAEITKSAAPCPTMEADGRHSGNRLPTRKPPAPSILSPSKLSPTSRWFFCLAPTRSSGCRTSSSAERRTSHEAQCHSPR